MYIHLIIHAAIKIHSKAIDKNDCQREKGVACKCMRVSNGEERNDTSSNDMYGQSDAESSPVEFSVEQEELFQSRFNEGYNLFIDPNYVSCLTIYHPEVSHPQIMPHFSDVTPETPMEVTEQGNVKFCYNNVAECYCSFCTAESPCDTRSCESNNPEVDATECTEETTPTIVKGPSMSPLSRYLISPNVP